MQYKQNSEIMSIDIETLVIELTDFENKLKLGLKLRRKKYSCLEEMLEYQEMTYEAYESLHSKYIIYIENKSVKSAVRSFPLITALLLIYTAIYRYNEEDSSGYWPEFFKADYNYQRDVPLVMDTINKLKLQYNILSSDRNVMQKKNLSEIFSNIYLPDVSLRKIYTCIYLYYFKSNKNKRINNQIDFVHTYEHKLDLLGKFLLSEDNLIADVYDKLIDLVRTGIQSPNDDLDYIALPKRFIVTFKEWYKKDKPDIDRENKTEEFYVSIPRIKLDTINEKILLILPKQKNRKISDKKAGWELNIDGDKSFLDARVIRQSSGSYLMLDEELELKKQSKIDVSYYYDGENKKETKIKFKEDYVVFDLAGNLIQNHIVKRSGCIIGLDSSIKFSSDIVVNEFQVNKWNNYIFYILDLKSYDQNKLNINEEIFLSIEDKPVIERTNFKLAFEQFNQKAFEESDAIYENYGDIIFISPNISDSDYKVYIDGSQRSKEFNKINNNTLKYSLENINEGVHYISIYYKDRSIYSENFMIYKQFKIRNQFNMSYSDESRIDSNRGIYVEKNPDFTIEAIDFKTKVYDTQNEYLIKPLNSPVVKFSVKFKDQFNPIEVKKIISPYNIDILGLEEIVEVNRKNKVIEITKTALEQTDIRIEVTNLDYNYSMLSYQLEIRDLVDNNPVYDIKKIKFDEITNWNLKNFNDRIIDFKNYIVLLNIINDNQEIIYQQKLINVVNEIKMIDFKHKANSEQIFLIWKEKELNKKKILKLYNLTSPYYDPIVFELEEGQYKLLIDSCDLKFDMYLPVLDYKKDDSIFFDLESEEKFFTKEKAEISFFNKYGAKDNKQAVAMTKAITYIKTEKEIEKIKEFLYEIDFSQVNLKNLFYELIQIKYLTDSNDIKALEKLSKIYYYILNKLYNYKSKEEVLREVYNQKDEFKKEDSKFLIHLVSSIKTKYTTSNALIDDILEISLIDSLFLIPNKSKLLTQNIQASCRTNFDLEILQKFKDYKEIFKVIEEEINQITKFWEWLSNSNNRKLIKDVNNNSKDILFRIYEEENKISSYKILGYTMDNLVSSITSENISLVAKSIFDKNNSNKIDKDLYDEFINITKKLMPDYPDYKEILEAAFIATYESEPYPDELYFELMFMSYFSKRKQLFDRYRAYFKLIMILRG